MGEVTDAFWNDQLDYVAECLGFLICNFCKHYHHHEATSCDAFPGGIPSIIRAGQFDHRQRHPDDHGIRFEKAETLHPSLQRRGNEADKPGWPDEISLSIAGKTVKVRDL